jgi:hypothetical protein
MKSNTTQAAGSPRIIKAMAIAMAALVAQGCASAPDRSAQGPVLKCHRIGAKFRQSCAPVAEASRATPAPQASGATQS